MSATLQQLEKLFEKREQFIVDAISKLETKTQVAAKKLLDSLLYEYSNKLQIADGKITMTPKNIATLKELEKVIDSFGTYMNNNVFGQFGKDLITITKYSESYFLLSGFKKNVLDKIKPKIEELQNVIGIKNNGELIKGGYINSLSRMPQVQQQVKEYVVKSIVQKTKYNDFLSGMKNLVTGRGGKIEQYVQQYTHDTYSAVGNISDNMYAEQLGLDHFLYAGSVMKSTRPFCKKRAGKVYTRKEALSWKNLTWAGKNEPYNPFVLPGGYNCRHQLMWISEDKYKEYKSKQK